MDPIFYAFVILLFVAVVLAFEGVYQWWHARHGSAAKRIESRIRAMSAGGQVQKERLSILKERMLNESKDRRPDPPAPAGDQRNLPPGFRHQTWTNFSRSAPQMGQVAGGSSPWWM